MFGEASRRDVLAERLIPRSHPGSQIRFAELLLNFHVPIIAYY